MAAPDLDLAAAIRDAQQGDLAAFDAIYDRFAEPLFRYLYARSGDVGVAEELTGELWIRVVERLPAFCPPANAASAAFTGWMYRIARNLLIDSYRRRDGGHMDLPETLFSRDPSPEERVLALEEQQDVRQAMEKLTPEQREVLVLRFVEQRNVADVAVRTGRSEGAVKVMQHRALKALARALSLQARTKDEL